MGGGWLSKDKIVGTARHVWAPLETSKAQQYGLARETARPGMAHGTLANGAKRGCRESTSFLLSSKPQRRDLPASCHGSRPTGRHLTDRGSLRRPEKEIPSE